MFKLHRLASFRLSSGWAAAQWVQYCCFAVAPFLFLLAIRTVTRMATTPFEIVLGILTAGTLAILVVVLGLVLPPTRRRDA